MFIPTKGLRGTWLNNKSKGRAWDSTRAFKYVNYSHTLYTISEKANTYLLKVMYISKCNYFGMILLEIICVNLKAKCMDNNVWTLSKL